MATSVVDGRIFAIGGLAPSAGVDASSSVGSDTPLARVEVYDPVSNTWAIATPMTTPRWSYGSVVVDGRIFVIGGTTSTGGEVRSQDELLRGLVMLDVVEEYDPRGGQWSTRSSLDGPRGWLSTSAVGGTIYVIGGRTEAMGGALGDVEIYGPRP